MGISFEVHCWLKRTMDETLYAHSLASSEYAVELARKYKADEEKARLAALIHDCAKPLPAKELINFALAFSIKLDDIEKNNPSLLHALVGAEMFEQTFGEVHSSVKKAVKRHTTGDANMDLLDKIIFVSDSLEPNRHYPGLVQIREQVRRDLDYGVYLVLQRKIQNTLEKRNPIHPRVLATWNWIVPIIKNKRL